MIFSKFERMAAWRYLRAKRKEGFISVITGFAVVGIALGVATLIIVMSVMNGFRAELLSRILGINGHIGIVSTVGLPFNNYHQAVQDIAAIENVKIVIPQIEKQLLATSGRAAEGAWCVVSAGRILCVSRFWPRDLKVPISMLLKVMW